MPSEQTPSQATPHDSSPPQPVPVPVASPEGPAAHPGDGSVSALPPGRSALSFVTRHWAIMVLAGAAAVLRGLVMAAYPPAFWFYGDSGAYITNSLRDGFDPQNIGGIGYTVALKVLRFTGDFTVVVALQHLTGLALGVAVYALLVRRGVPRWLACLAAVPSLFDAVQLTLEHYVLSETLFTTLAVAAVMLLLWPERPSAAACATAGLLMTLSWLTRPSTVPLAAVLLLYLLVRRAGWQRTVAYAAAFAVPYAAVMLWIGDRPSAYNNSFANRALFSRVAGFVDCERVPFTPQERALCPQEPLGQRHDRPDWYGWNGPAMRVPRGDNEILRTFAVKTVKAQPGDYTHAVLRELAPHFVPGAPLGPEMTCLRGKWTLPRTVRDEPVKTSCTPALAQDEWRHYAADPAQAPPPTALSTALHGYGAAARFGPPLATLACLLALAALVTMRRHRFRDALDAVTLTLAALALLVPPVLVAMYEARYGLPALPFTAMAAALAVHHLLGTRRARPQPAAVTR